MIDFNDLDYDELLDEWSLSIKIDSIKDFRFVEIFGQRTNYYESGTDLEIIFEKGDFNELQEFQKNAVIYFYNNQEKVLNAISDGIIKYINEFINEAWETDYDIKTRDNVKDSITIYSIKIFDVEKDNVAYYSFTGNCIWDTEHAWGMTMYKDHVFEVGQWDVSQYFNPEMDEDNPNHQEYLNRVKAAKLRFEQELIELHKKKWWEFWK